MYAIAFDMIVSNLRTHYGERYRSAYSEIRKMMEENDFSWGSRQYLYYRQRIGRYNNGDDCIEQN